MKTRLLTPGPVPIPKIVKDALAQPIIHHRTPEFEATLAYCLAALRKLFGTNGEVFIHASTGSGGMESAIVNTLNPGDEVICVVSGKFGERWAYMAELYGLKVYSLQVPWGEAVSMEEFERVLTGMPQVKAVLTQACETSTATLHPIQEMAKLVKNKTNALFMVDAITAMGCLPMPMKDWSLDVVVAGSQKALMLPTGLSFVGVSKRAMEISKKNLQPKFYFEWAHESDANGKSQTFFSSPTTLIRALAAVLREFEGSGAEVIQHRCKALAQGTRAAAEALGLEIFSRSPSPSVTAISLPPSIPGEKLRDWLESERGVTVMGGQDKLKNRILRIGHMGDISDEDMHYFFESLAQGLDQLAPGFASGEKLPLARQALEKHLLKAKSLFS